jgi:cbb3-type cytochrome oxidase cytochrome c subunit/mono/diheme cytochrome c family protein
MSRFLRMSYVVAGVAGLGFFVMSVLLLGVWPGRVLEEQMRGMSPGHALELTASEKRGRMIYAREGCAYCHTQQIRYAPNDTARFGAATLAWETIFDYPHLWGTRRIGPDLSREASARSADWQLSHLYAPRTIVQDSVMPPFPWLFDGAPDRPRQEGLDLLAYLETLGRDRALAAPEGEAHARAACDCSDDERRFAFGSAALNASPAIARRQGDSPKLGGSSDLRKGQEIYSRNCASCHGIRGEGDGPGAPGLHPHPVNLSEHEYKLDRMSFSLWNGVAGTAMPAWRDLPVADLSAVSQVVRAFHTAQPEAAIPQAVLSLGGNIYAARCAQCHGKNGAGDGYAIEQFAIAPTNFQTQRPSLAATLRALRNGIEGTPMAPWTNELSEAELSAVAYYVRGFFEGVPKP